MSDDAVMRKLGELQIMVRDIQRVVRALAELQTNRIARHSGVGGSGVPPRKG